MVVYSSENPRAMEMGLGADFVVGSPDDWEEASLMRALKKLSILEPYLEITGQGVQCQLTGMSKEAIFRKSTEKEKKERGEKNPPRILNQEKGITERKLIRAKKPEVH